MDGVHWKEQGSLAAGDQNAVKTRLFGNGGFKTMSSLLDTFLNIACGWLWNVT